MKFTNYWLPAVIAGVAALLLGGIVLLRSDTLHHRVFPVQASQTGTTLRTTAAAPTLQEENRLIFVQSADPDEQALIQSTSQALRYAKVPYATIDPDRLASVTAGERTVLLVAATDLTPLAGSLQTYIAQGGRVVFLQRTAERPAFLNRILGVKASGPDRRATGLVFNQTLFPGYPDIAQDDSDAFTHESAGLQLTRGTKVLLSSQEKVPLLIEAANGRVQYWNTHFLHDKLARGLFLHSVGRLLPQFVTAQAGVQVMHIDDFPAPVPHQTTTVADASGTPMSIRTFYEEHWWPDMVRIARKYNLKYTGALIGTYTNDTAGRTIDLYQTMRKTGQKFTRAMHHLGGELSLHGYNHQPLLLASDPADVTLKYRPWPSAAAMQPGLAAVGRLAKTLAPNDTLTTYVPPSNLLSSTGVTAVRTAFPRLDTIAALYYGDTTDSRYVTEYGPNATAPNLLNFPRSASGYLLAPMTQYHIAEVASTLGVVSHFIHPDDVFDEARNSGQNWADLARGYEKMAAHIARTYPQITPLTQHSASAALRQYLQGRLDVRYGRNRIQLLSRDLPHLSSAVVRLTPGQTLRRSPAAHITRLAAGLYSVQPRQANVTLTIERGVSQ
ncbi:DUF2194 domain-containing protein [Schleiferilactobacillus shenzhenensis]|uniref:DUF2194 domain-containing protein n=1 Tax=Schleiferilactobacillus shenzhenensis TaxID=1231337 RepID=UPI000405C487|nr:DUF2194 domain-containing protein [Schleiferilactobacillus shenzhenensis]